MKLSFSFSKVAPVLALASALVSTSACVAYPASGPGYYYSGGGYSRSYGGYGYGRGYGAPRGGWRHHHRH